MLQRKRVGVIQPSGRTVERVCVSVAMAPRLRELSLDCLSMIKSNCKPLCDGLSSQKCLIRTLKLERCLVAMALASPLGSALGQNRSIRHLSLRRTTFGGTDADTFRRFFLPMARNETLEVLDLSEVQLAGL